MATLLQCRETARAGGHCIPGEGRAFEGLDEDVHPDVQTDGVACSDLLGRQQHVEHSEGGEEEEILKVEPSDVESVTSYTVGSTTTIGRSDVESIASYSVTGQEDVVADAAPGAPLFPGDEARRTSRPGPRCCWNQVSSSISMHQRPSGGYANDLRPSS